MITLHLNLKGQRESLTRTACLQDLGVRVVKVVLVGEVIGVVGPSCERAEVDYAFVRETDLHLFAGGEVRP